MKTLYLLRHAKSSWSEAGLADRERPLSKRGLGDAPRMGQRFAGRGESLHRVVTSPARRAHHTAELFCGCTGVDGLPENDRVGWIRSDYALHLPDPPGRELVQPPESC